MAERVAEAEGRARAAEESARKALKAMEALEKRVKAAFEKGGVQLPKE